MLDRTIRNTIPQITSAVIPKKIQSDANTERVSTAADVITRVSDDHWSRTNPISGSTSSTSGNAS